MTGSASDLQRGDLLRFAPLDHKIPSDLPLLHQVTEWGTDLFHLQGLTGNYTCALYGNVQGWTVAWKTPAMPCPAFCPFELLENAFAYLARFYRIHRSPDMKLQDAQNMIADHLSTRGKPVSKQDLMKFCSAERLSAEISETALNMLEARGAITTFQEGGTEYAQIEGPR